MALPPMYVEAPPTTPLPYGLLSAALVLSDLTGHGQAGVQYEPEACGVAYATRAACEDADAAFTEGSTGVPLVVGAPFNLYHLFRCTPVGGLDIEDRARQSLSNGESRGAEAGLARLLPVAEGAVDLTPASGAVHAVEGLARLEGFTAANYGAVPVIHTPRTVGTLLTAAGAVIRSGAHLETVQGALVASGGGYEGLAGPLTNAADPESVQAPVDGEAWLYATGTVVVRRSSQAEVIPMTMARTPQATNDAVSLAIRPYVITWECVTAAVRVSTTYGGVAL